MSMRSFITSLILTLQLAFLVSANAAPTDTYEFSDPVTELRYKSLTKELRCPKCQNQDIADSNAVVAKDMRHKTLELLKEGKSKQQVIDYMVNRYGQFAHYRPPMNIATLLLWLVPLGFVLLALMLLWRRSRTADKENLPATDEEALDAELDALLKGEADSVSNANDKEQNSK
mgnify:CR=1 FL=1